VGALGKAQQCTVHCTQCDTECAATGYTANDIIIGIESSVWGVCVRGPGGGGGAFREARGQQCTMCHKLLQATQPTTSSSASSQVSACVFVGGGEWGCLAGLSSE
jgi:hypothetical protein